MLSPAPGHPALVAGRIDDVQNIGQVSQVPIHQITVGTRRSVVGGFPRHVEPHEVGYDVRVPEPARWNHVHAQPRSIGGVEPGQPFVDFTQ